MTHRMRRLFMVVLGSLVIAGIASAAGNCPPCHPNIPGTRSLTVTGAVTSYRFGAPGTVAVSVQGAGVVRWNYKSTTDATASVSGRGGTTPGAVSQKLVAAQGDLRVRIALAPNGVATPDRLNVFDRATGKQIASWPLIQRPARVALYGGIALLSPADRGALFALRLSDGRIAELGIARAGDRPTIGSQGVVYQDAIYLRPTRHGLATNQVMLKFLPLASVARQLRMANREIVTTRINAIAMDGQRVAFAVHDPAGQCDRVKIWVPSWHFVAHVTKTSGATCLPTHAAGGVTNVAIAGNRIVYTTKYGQTTRVLALSAIACQEWVVARPARGGAPVAALAGQGNTLAYALRGGTVGVVPAHWQGKVVSHSTARISAMSVDNERIAVLYRDGTVTIMTKYGVALSSFAVGSATAVTLRGDTLAVLHTGGRLELYNATTGALAQSWAVPVNARTVGVYYGIAVIAAGHDLLALNLATGKTATLLHAPGRVAAQIDAPGAIVKFNAGGHGHLRFIQMSTLEARTS